jgi:hypothetical protein
MRTVNWLFLVSAALFISGIAFVIAGARTTLQATPTEAPAAVTVPVASVKQIMNGITGPAATKVWEAVSTTVDAAGITEKFPKTDEEWAAVGDGAAAIVESANLLMLGDRAVDQDEWIKMSRALADTGVQALKAVEAKNPDKVVEEGEKIYQACTTCHERYQR